MNHITYDVFLLFKILLLILNSKLNKTPPLSILLDISVMNLEMFIASMYFGKNQVFILRSLFFSNLMMKILVVL